MITRQDLSTRHSGWKGALSVNFGWHSTAMILFIVPGGPRNMIGGRTSNLRFRRSWSRIAQRVCETVSAARRDIQGFQCQ